MSSTERSWPKTSGKGLRRTPDGSPATRPKVVPLGSCLVAWEWLHVTTVGRHGQGGERRQEGKTSLDPVHVWFKVLFSHCSA